MFWIKLIYPKGKLHLYPCTWTVPFFYQNLEMRLNGFFFLLFGAFFTFFFLFWQINQSCYIFPVLFHYQFFFIEQGMTFLWVLFSFHRPQITVKAQWGIFQAKYTSTIFRKKCFSKIIWCFSDPQTLVWNHWSYFFFL